MVLNILRALFVLVMAAVGWYFIEDARAPLGANNWLAMAIALSIGVLFVSIDILAPRRKLAIFSGSMFGLIVGILLAYGLSFVVNFLIAQWRPGEALPGTGATELTKFYAQREGVRDFVNMLVGVTTCYLSISFILQTKDDFRFIIPFVEFAKQTRGSRPIVVDTSALIDGRIADVAAAGVFDCQILVPQFVLDELQAIADSGDKLRRNRGRAGLDVLQKMRDNARLDITLYDTSNVRGQDQEGVDQKLTALAVELHARILTTDFNLNKVATLRGVDVINLNDLANSLKPVVFAGERMQVRLLKQGQEPGQGVGYLEDGTMVVVEHGRGHLNEDVEFAVTNVLQTSAGKIIFGQIEDGPGPGSDRPDAGPGGGGRGRRPRMRPDASSSPT
jgi:uncharacterized protein YacL